MNYLFLALGLWRSWLGGGIGKDWPITKGLGMLQYAAAILLAFAANHWAWKIGLIDGLGIIALARVYGHGPMLRYPLNDDPDGDFILSAVGGPGGGTLRYLSYGAIRYLVPALAWTVARAVVGHPGIAPLCGAVGIIVCYYAFTRIKAVWGEALPTFTTPGDESSNLSEIVGWTILGACLALSA